MTQFEQTVAIEVIKETDSFQSLSETQKYFVSKRYNRKEISLALNLMENNKPLTGVGHINRKIAKELFHKKQNVEFNN